MQTALKQSQFFVQQIVIAYHAQKKQGVASWPNDTIESMTYALKVANGYPEYLNAMQAILQVSAQEIQKSIIAYLLQNKLHQPNEPFQMLCVPPLASQHQCKEHYRLLIRLFHPDRGLVDAKQAEQYAANINLAFSTTKRLLEKAEVEKTANHKSSFEIKQTAQSKTVQPHFVSRTHHQKAHAKANSRTWWSFAKRPSASLGAESVSLEHGKKPTRRPNEKGFIYWLVTSGVTPKKIWLLIVVAVCVWWLSLYIRYHMVA